MSKPKKPPPAFEMRFDEEGVYPETVPLNMLSRALSAVQRLAAGIEATDEDENGDVIDGRIGLLQVNRGSAVYQITTQLPQLALANLELMGHVLGNPESIGDREYMLNPLEELSAVSKSLGSPIVLKYPGKDGAILATIVPTTYSIVSRSLLISGDTTIYGKVERVGGASGMRCGLRLDNRARMLICNVDSAEAARHLGDKLYEKVAVKGTAQWLKTTWKVIGFTIREVRQPRLKPFKEMINSLRDAGGSGWDSIPDPQAFLDKVTG